MLFNKKHFGAPNVTLSTMDAAVKANEVLTKWVGNFNIGARNGPVRETPVSKRYFNLMRIHIATLAQQVVNLGTELEEQAAYTEKLRKENDEYYEKLKEAGISLAPEVEAAIE